MDLGTGVVNIFVLKKTDKTENICSANLNSANECSVIVVSKTNI